MPHYHDGIWGHKHDGHYHFRYPSDRGDKVANLLEYSVAPGPRGPF